MGAADTVPGVSGGTVALVLGHYRRLLTAISRFDAHAVRLLAGGQLAALGRYCDLRFLAVLAAGLVLGAGALANTMHWLLEHRLAETFAVFLGLILASGYVVARWIRRWSPAALAALASSSLVAYWLGGLVVGQAVDSRLYLVFSAMIAICAMILPGISGAFVLLLLGMYHTVIGMVKQLARLQLSADLLLDIGLFAAGCVIGLGLFSRLLRWLLQAHPDVTLAALLGLMLGSARRVWPLQRPSEATADLALKEQQFEFVSPGQWGGSLASLLILGLGAAAAVIVIERGAEALDRRSRQRHGG